MSREGFFLIHAILLHKSGVWKGPDTFDSLPPSGSAKQIEMKMVAGAFPPPPQLRAQGTSSKQGRHVKQPLFSYTFCLRLPGASWCRSQGAPSPGSRSRGGTPAASTTQPSRPPRAGRPRAWPSHQALQTAVRLQSIH